MKNKTIIILLLLIILLQTIIVVYAANKREDYHIDEYYSHGLIQYDNTFIMENEDFYNNWHSAQYFKDYVIIKEQDKLDFSAVYNNQVKDVHPPMYYLLLRIACSFNINNFSKWPGIILNIIIASMCTVILYFIGKKLSNSSYMAILLCAVNAMCIGTVETITFIRMYKLFTLNSLLLIYYHIINKDKKLENKDLILLGILVITGFLTHYYYAIIVASLYFIYIAKFIKKKQKNELLKYTATMLISVLIAIIIFPYCINHIFFGYRGQEVISNIGNVNKYISGIQEFVAILNEHILNGNEKVIILIIAILTIIAVIEKIINRKKEDSANNTNSKYVIIPTVVYFFVIALGCRYRDFRYIMPIIPLVLAIIIYIIKELLMIWANKKLTLAIITILSILFCYTNISKYSDNLYTYKGTNEIIEKTIEIIGDKPFILVTDGTDASYSKFLETYQMVSRVNETFILNYSSMDNGGVNKALEDKDISNGVIVMVRRNREEEVIKETLKTGLFSGYSEKVRGIFLYYKVLEFK